MRIASIPLVIALTSFGCAAPDAAPPAPDEVDQSTGDSLKRATDAPIARIERTDCFGFCPAYVVTFYAGGLVELRGIQNVPHLGMVQVAIDDDEIAKLDDAFAAAHFDQLEPTYDDQPQLDTAWVFVTRYTTRGPKTVKHHLGSVAPDKLVELEDRLDTLSGVDRWLVKTAKDTAVLGYITH
jgi:hypothetical protein